jgi:hypothetical protein
MELFRCLAAALVLLSVAAPACGGGNADTGASASGANAGGSGSGGTSAGAIANGGANDKSGGSSSGGSASGASGSGNAGSTTTMACHDASECPESTKPPLGGIPQCLSPGQSAPFGGCGAPQWCGQCECPEQPPQPEGAGMPCDTSDDCPAGEGAARICAQGQCTRCVADTDCPADAPACSLVEGRFGASYNFCTACTTNEHCPGATPLCSLQYGIGQCVSCQGNGDCAQGVCNGSECVPGCGQALPCGSPLQECTAELRCVPRACSSAVDCGTNADCNNGRCGLRACSSDVECSGYCVNHICYATLGTCFTVLAVP